jgi:ubiquinone/menaquinone biosynthesis C-methylase UbiE
MAATTHHGFDRRRSESYDRLARRALGGLYRRVAGHVAAAAAPGAAVVDVGTGPGRLLHALAERRPDLSLTGVDVSPDMISVAERQARARGLAGALVFRVGDVGALPLEDDSADLLVSTLSMHHWPDLDAAGRELARVLRPGGQALLYDFRFAPIGRAMAALRARPGAFPHVVRERAGLRWNPLPLHVRIRAGG